MIETLASLALLLFAMTFSAIASKEMAERLLELYKERHKR